MEVDFDKEIDALLRQDGRGRTITISEFSAPHIDADELAAFAENALPEGARKLYVTHLADCDPCRTQLSSLITLNAEAEPVSAVSNEAIAPLAASESVPWYRNLFAVRNLALGMGALLVLFTGFFAFIIFSGGLGGDMAASNASANRSLAKQAQELNAPAYPANAAATNSVSNAASSPAMAANANAYGEPASRPELGTNYEADGETVARAQATPPGATLDGADLAIAAKPVPPPPPVAAAPMTQPKDDEPSAEETVRTRENEEKLKEAERSIPTQVSRGAGTVNDQAANVGRSENRTARSDRGRDMAALKRSAPSRMTVGGKTFDKRQGVWYDSAFSGQSTTNVRRNTNAYRALDSGLRTIAESLEGVVVVVWNSKAYRIQ